MKVQLKHREAVEEDPVAVDIVVVVVVEVPTAE